MTKLALFGCGNFGIEIYKEIKKISLELDVELEYVITESGRKIDGINPAAIMSANNFEISRVGNIDGVIIATPSSTHSELAIRLLKHTNVLIEKPVFIDRIAINKIISAVRESPFRLIPAHNFRFNPCVDKVAELLVNFQSKPISISGVFVNPANPRLSSIFPEHEMLHLPDVVDYLYRWEPQRVWKSRDRNVCNLHVKYVSGCDAKYSLGWVGIEEKTRNLRIEYERGSISIDFIKGIIECIFPDGGQVKYFVTTEPISINAQLRNFIGVINGYEKPRASIDDAVRVNSVLSADDDSTLKKMRALKRPRIGVVGGGIFGVANALELSKFAEVTVLEKNEDLLLGASLQNQWRHHSGFHYPLSYETAIEIQKTKKLFEDEFGDSISYGATSYYCVSANAKEIPAERYLAACNLYGLRYKLTAAPEMIKPGSISACLETDEGLYDIDVLRDLMHAKIRSAKSIDLICGADLVDASINERMVKEISVMNGGKCIRHEFDLIINCTYSNLLKINSKFGIKNLPVRLEEVELLELKLPFPSICLTIIDGPFVSLTSMLSDRRFFLSHRDHSVLRRTYSSFDYRSPSQVSNRLNIINAASEYIDGVDQESYVKSWITHKAISTNIREQWDRPTVLFDHGFGVWSVIGGKILTAVANAKDLSSLIRKELSL